MAHDRIISRDEGHEVEVRVTYEEGDSDRVVQEALERKDVDVLVAAGGDGSVNEVLTSPHPPAVIRAKITAKEIRCHCNVTSTYQ